MNVKPYYAGAAWAAFADYTRWHKPLLILTSVLALLSRISTAFVSSFAMICVVALLSETFTAPVSILSDIAIMSAAKTVCSISARQASTVDIGSYNS